MDDNPQQNTTSHNAHICQDAAKTENRGRVRSGMGTVNYWKNRLYRNSYRDRDGLTVEIPEYYARMRYAGKTRQVRLDHSNRDSAAEQALQLFSRLQTYGWKVIDDRKAHLPSSPTIDDFLEAYEKATRSMDKAPRPITIRTYSRNLRQICAIAGILKIRELTPEIIERARGTYRAKARAAGRQDSSIRNTLSTLIRNAAACFSKEARAIMARDGLTIENPFAGIRCGSDIRAVSPLPIHTMDEIWADAHLLRDGDPTAHAIKLDTYIKNYKKAHGGRTPGRWIPIDWRQPRPDAYATLLLAIGCGFRANECDKARWSWLTTDGKGNFFIEVRPEIDFRPKGDSIRTVKIPAELHDGLLSTRNDMGPYIIGGPPSTDSSKQGGGLYRRPNTFRAVNQWLRNHGVEAGNKHGKPLHALRKQFGSEVATSFGLFHAQKLLGHSSPMITAKHYAGQVNLPNLTHVHIAGK